MATLHKSHDINRHVPFVARIIPVAVITSVVCVTRLEQTKRIDAVEDMGSLLVELLVHKQKSHVEVRLSVPVVPKTC